MSFPSLIESQVSLSAAPLAGFWQLPVGRALKLQPRQAGVLRIAQGRAWVTFDGPHAGHANALGDHVLLGGEQLAVAAGKELVIESLDPAVGPAMLFAWTPSPTAASASVVPTGAGLAQPLRDLWQTLRMGAAALARLFVGLFDHGQRLLTGRHVRHARHCG